MLNFVQENRGEKLWNPQDSEALRHKSVVEARYPVASRLNAVLFESSSNVLTSRLIKAVSELFSLDSCSGGILASVKKRGLGGQVLVNARL